MWSSILISIFVLGSIFIIAGIWTAGYEQSQSFLNFKRRFKLQSQEKNNPLKVDFKYAFATPHRLTVGMPDSSHKTLLDLEPGMLRLLWTYDDLRDKPVASFTTPQLYWDVNLTPELDGAPFKSSHWTRADGWLPILKNRYEAQHTRLQMEVVGGATAAIIRVEVSNTDQQPHNLTLRCEKPGGWTGYNPAWVQPEMDPDVLLAGWVDRADRILVFCLGGDKNPVTAPTTLNLVWHLAPGETKIGWIIRPYEAIHAQLPKLREQDWAQAFDAAKTAWKTLIGQAAKISIPDPGIENAFYAGLADCFIMREPVADGSIAACPGTKEYRAPNPFEPLLVSLILDQVGLHEQAAGNTHMFLQQQGADGNWADPAGWSHLTWGASGMKSWAIMEHYRITKDKKYLADVYPRMIASSRWQEQQRARTRILVEGERPLTYGLMPRGMGDGGLKNDDDLYGVFFIHNILAVFADALTVEAAEILKKIDDLPELKKIHQQALTDLLTALDRGAINEKDYRWIPGVPGKTSGSRWGALYAASPCKILPPQHELITGTIRKIEARMSPGGLPVHTGWMENGMWVAMTLDNLAEALLLRGESDAAIRYLYATLNHGTPLYSWCEERGQEPGSAEITGDRQHLWTPVAVARFIRNALVLEDGDTLHLARGAARHWLTNHQSLGVTGMATHFGRVSFEIKLNRETSRLQGKIKLDEQTIPRLMLHLRLPEGLQAKTPALLAGGCLNADRTAIEWQNVNNTIEFEVAFD